MEEGVREIKFRCWSQRAHDEEGDGWLYGSNADMFRWLAEGQEVLLEQYTGLKDRDGVEIYEGDIVETRFHHQTPPRAGVVKWFQVHTHYSIDCGDNQLMSVGFSGSAVAGKYVIGNIHQHPELLQ